MVDRIDIPGGARAHEGAAAFLAVLAYPGNDQGGARALFFDVCFAHGIRSVEDELRRQNLKDVSRRDKGVERWGAEAERALIARIKTQQMWHRLEDANTRIAQRLLVVAYLAHAATAAEAAIAIAKDSAHARDTEGLSKKGVLASNRSGRVYELIRESGPVLHMAYALSALVPRMQPTDLVGLIGNPFHRDPTYQVRWVERVSAAAMAMKADWGGRVRAYPALADFDQAKLVDLHNC